MYYLMIVIISTFLLLLKVPGFQLDKREQLRFQWVLCLCYWFTQNFQKAQALMQKSLEQNRQLSQLPELELYITENALTLGQFYRYNKTLYGNAKTGIAQELTVHISTLYRSLL